MSADNTHSSAAADALRALMPFASMMPPPGRPVIDSVREAARVLREHAPCERCGGNGHVPTGDHDHYGRIVTDTCDVCSGARWTPASVEAAIAREEERERLAAAVFAAANLVRVNAPLCDSRSCRCPMCGLRRDLDAREASRA